MDLGRYLFSIAVVADTHMNEVEYGSASPYECNRIANARTRYVVERLNQIDPALTIHLGDLVHPVPGMPTYAQAADNFARYLNEFPRGTVASFERTEGVKKLTTLSLKKLTTGELTFRERRRRRTEA